MCRELRLILTYLANEGSFPEREGFTLGLNLEISRIEDVAVIRCSGGIVFEDEADELRRTILNLLAETKRIVLNLASVSRIDSCGLGTLVSSFISARNRGAVIKLAAVSPRASQVLRVAKVPGLFEVYESDEEAIKSLYPHPRAASG